MGHWPEKRINLLRLHVNHFNAFQYSEQNCNMYSYWKALNGNIHTNWVSYSDPLSVNPTKWSNTLKQFVGNNRRVP